jgi:hypothetical protein
VQLVLADDKPSDEGLLENTIPFSRATMETMENFETQSAPW